MNSNKSISRKFLITVVVITTSLIALIAAVSIFVEYNEYKHECEFITNTYINEQETIIKYEVERAVNLIEYRIKNSKLSLEAVKRISLDQLREIRFPNKGNDPGFFFVKSYDGIQMLSVSTPELEGKDVSQYTDPNGILTHDLFMNAVLESRGGFADYSWFNPFTKKIQRKRSYVKGIPELQWYVAAGFWFEDINSVIDEKRAYLKSDVRNYVLRLILILLISYFAIYIISRNLSNKIEDSFKEFSLFFSNAATQNINIKKENLNYIEFEELAVSANQMISERKNAENKLNDAFKKREELEFIINKSQVIAFLWRAKEGWPVEYVSENINLFGYSADDFYSGKIAYSDIIHPDDLEQVTNEVITASEKGNDEFKQQYRILTKSGDIRWTDDITWIRRDEKGNITHYQGIVFDITERKLSEMHIQQLSSILEDSLNEIFVFDADTFQFIYANQGAVKNIGYSLDELIKLSPVDIKPEVDSKKFNKLIEPLKSGKNHKIVFETVHERKDKSFYNVEIHLQKSIFNEKDVYVAIILDITERKKTEKELEKHSLNLEELVSERTEQLEKLNLDFAEKNENLDRMNKVFVNRELRIKELKDEIARLKEK